METALITGGMGFMGSHLTLKLSTLYKRVIVVDAFTYAARNVKFPENVYIEKCDIRDHWALSKVFEKYEPQICFHLAAESHVCRSIEGPRDFFHTNAIGTFHVAEECYKQKSRMVHISTDEVFGEIRKGRFTECSPYFPRSPYAASKASGDHIVRCYGETFGLDYIIVHPSNNFGPNQHEEKLVPRTIRNVLSGNPIVVHGKGDHRREWLWVGDFVDGVVLLSHKGKTQNSYCLGGSFESTNLELMKLIVDVIKDLWPKRFREQFSFTNDRPTDDFRYAMSSLKAKALGFKPQTMGMKTRLRETVLWYMEPRI